jgi:hypothetical protein
VRNQTRYLVSAVLVFVCLLAIALYTARAQSGGGYDLTWNTVDGGLAPASGGDFNLSGTIGQPEAGAELTGGLYSLAGGFWNGVPIYKVCIPAVHRS